MVCYDFFPFRLNQFELLGIRDHNECPSRENSSLGIRLVYEIVEGIAGL
jgi:hypothetical protein